MRFFDILVLTQKKDLLKEIILVFKNSIRHILEIKSLEQNGQLLSGWWQKYL